MLDSYTNAQWANAASEAMMTVAAQRDPYVLMRPRVFPDEGGMWCALYGENIQDGVAGFGATPALACADFDKNWMNQRLPHGVREDGNGC